MDRLRYLEELVNEIVNDLYGGLDTLDVAWHRLKLSLALSGAALQFCSEIDDCFHRLVKFLNKYRVMYEEKSNHWGE